MKNLSLILNVILLIAVGVLYYLHFTHSSGSPATDKSVSSTMTGDFKIAFVNSDSILEHYEYFEKQKKQLESTSKKLEQEFTNRVQGFQNEVNDYQRNVGNLTLAQAKALEENLGKKQQNLKLYEQSLSQQLMNEEAKFTKDLYDRITSFVTKYGKENGLQVILKQTVGSDLLYAGDSLDITDQVILGLNDEYKQELEKPKNNQSDSTAIKKK